MTALATLDARPNDVLRLQADGPDARELLASLQEFAARSFGETDGSTHATAGAGSTGPCADEHVTPPTGKVSGPACRLPIDAPESTASVAEPLSLDEAVARARADLAEVRQRACDVVNADAADMIAAQVVLLEDQALLAPVRQAIAEHQDPVTAWKDQIHALRAQFESLEDEYLSARGQDVSSVGRRVTAYLQGRALPDVSEARGVVIVDELDAPTAVLLDSDKVVAVVTRRGGGSGHGVMVATTRGIPVLVDAAGDFDGVAEGAEITIDLDPTAQSA